MSANPAGNNSISGKTAVLLMRENPNQAPEPYKMEELEGLAKAAGYKVLAEITQRRGRDHRFQLGRGKIQEAMAYQSDKLIFYNPLSPGQVFNIKAKFSASIMDRFNLILEIFASRASSREAKLQVELARLTYDAPQVRNAISLKKLGEQPGFGGSGAYDESMYQDIRSRIAKIRSSLMDVEFIGEDRRQKRRELGFDLVTLAGYTNAGKSTLLNRLTDAGVEVRDQLFTTLSPTTRALDIKGRKILLTDTVGFIDDLPHFMIKAFRSTLSEISQADLVLLVADISDPPEILRRKLAASHKALWDCGSQRPTITVFNKADRLARIEAMQRLEKVLDLAPSPVLISASDGWGFVDLIRMIHQRLPPLKEVQIKLPYTPEGMSELSKLYDRAELLNIAYEEQILVRLRGKEDIVTRALSSKARQL
jgi:GTP-binding protein HflX